MGGRAGHGLRHAHRAYAQRGCSPRDARSAGAGARTSDRGRDCGGRRLMRQRSAKVAVLLICLALAAPLRAQDVNMRFSSLGHKMICGCGCNQILLECNHVGCPLSEGMRNELTAALKRGQSDGQILDAFVEKYGPTILAAPTMSGFNLTAWITPFAVLLAAFASAVLVIRGWKRRPLRAVAGTPQTAAPYLDEVRRETEL